MFLVDSRNTASSVLPLVIFVLVASGCGGPSRPSVDGHVTLDGQPLEQGSISFIPTGTTQGPLTGSIIADGEYHIDSASGPVVGQYKVEIRASMPTGKQVPLPPPAPPGAMIDEVAEVIPSRYNTESTLTAEVKEKKNKLDFHLKSNK